MAFVSTVKLTNVHMSNIQTEERIMNMFEVTNISITNLNTYNLKSSDRDEIFYFWRCIIDLVTLSTHTDSQFIVYHFRESTVTEFSHNILSSMYKGIQIEDSVASITNTTIKSMVQNERSGLVEQSQLSVDGSAIRKCILIKHYRHNQFKRDNFKVLFQLKSCCERGCYHG